MLVKLIEYMSLLLEQQIKKKSLVLSFALFLICTAVLLCLAYFVALWYFQPQYKDVASTDIQKVVPVADDSYLSKGRIYYSAVRRGESERHLFELDVTSKTSKLLNNTSGIYQITRFQSGVEATSYIQKDGKSVIELIVTDKNGVQETQYIFAPVHTQAGRIVWNKDRTVLFYEAVSLSTTTTVVDETTLYAYNLLGKTTTKLTEGQSPVMFDADTVLFLRNDGVYELALDSALMLKAVTQVEKFTSQQVTRSSSMLFSPDKKTLLVSYPESAHVDVNTVTLGKNQEVVFTATGHMEESMISPISTQDGRYIVFFEKGVATSSYETALSSVDIKTGKKITEAVVLADGTQPMVISFWK